MRLARRSLQSSMSAADRRESRSQTDERTDDWRHTVVQAPQASIDDFLLVVVTIGQTRVCAVQIRVGRGIVEL